MPFCPTVTSQAPKKAKRRAAAEGGSSNVFSMFDQTQIQEFKEVRVTEDPSLIQPPFWNVHLSGRGWGEQRGEFLPQLPRRGGRGQLADGQNLTSPWSGSAGWEVHGNLTPLHSCPPQAFTVIDQNRDGIIDKEDLRDTFAAMGELLPTRVWRIQLALSGFHFGPQSTQLKNSGRA